VKDAVGCADVRVSGAYRVDIDWRAVRAGGAARDEYFLRVAGIVGDGALRSTRRVAAFRMSLTGFPTNFAQSGRLGSRIVKVVVVVSSVAEGRLNGVAAGVDVLDSADCPPPPHAARAPAKARMAHSAMNTCAIDSPRWRVSED
jgi:hypothetical protein